MSKEPLYPHIPKSQLSSQKGLEVSSTSKIIYFTDERGYMYTLDMERKVLSIPILGHDYRVTNWSTFVDRYGNDLFIQLNARGFSEVVYKQVNDIVIKMRDKAAELWSKEITFNV